MRASAYIIENSFDLEPMWGNFVSQNNLFMSYILRKVNIQQPRFAHETSAFKG
jgi:hypothetical protein